MALSWNEAQKEIYRLITEGTPTKEIKKRGYTPDLIKKVQKAIKRGDTPGTSAPPQLARPGESLFEISTKGVREALEPIILMRYDAFRNVFGWSKDEYPLGQFIDEASDLACQLAGAVPPGFVKVEEKEEVSSGRT